MTQSTPRRIGFFGEPGAYSQAAAETFAPSWTSVPYPSLDEVFGGVASRAVDAGMVPVENSTGGTIHRTYDLFLSHACHIVGEVELQIDHCLLTMGTIALEEVTQVFSHPQAIAQCERFLRELPRVEVVSTYDTAGSAKLIRERGLTTAAAIASSRAADVFGMHVLRRGIQDYTHNVTRFLAICRDGDVPFERLPPADKTTFVFSLPDEPGSLHRALAAFASQGIDLSKLESRPIPGRPWEYLFYADLAVAATNPSCTAALRQLAGFAPMCRVLGSYAAWHSPATSTSEPSTLGARSASS